MYFLHLYKIISMCGWLKYLICAISWQGVPLVYLPLESIMSKYYGESERLLGKVFVHANEFPEGAIVFLDEVIDATNSFPGVFSKIYWRNIYLPLSHFFYERFFIIVQALVLHSTCSHINWTFSVILTSA